VASFTWLANAEGGTAPLAATPRRTIVRTDENYTGFGRNRRTIVRRDENYTGLSRHHGPAGPLKTEISRTAVPIPAMLALDLSAHFAESGAETVLVNEYDRPLAPWTLERSMRSARAKVPALQPGFRYHDYADVRVMPTFPRMSCSAG